jgi:hypothetical protein
MLNVENVFSDKRASLESGVFVITMSVATNTSKAVWYTVAEDWAKQR